MIEIEVVDTGEGISPEKSHFIFDMFEQVDSSATRRYGGVGLKLYIVKKFTEILGGRVVVKSEFGGGSTFRVRLPVGVATGESDSPVSQRPVL
jgi:signal transduction histidine kinase